MMTVDEARDALARLRFPLIGMRDIDASLLRCLSGHSGPVIDLSVVELQHSDQHGRILRATVHGGMVDLEGVQASLERGRRAQELWRLEHPEEFDGWEQSVWLFPLGDGQLRFEGSRNGSRWACTALGHGYAVSLVSDGFEPEEVVLQLVTDFEPYLAGLTRVGRRRRVAG